MFFHIHHLVNLHADINTIPAPQRELVGTVEASSLEEAFENSQNFEKAWNPACLLYTSDAADEEL
jgi:hypothetical protein